MPGSHEAKTAVREWTVQLRQGTLRGGRRPDSELKRICRDTRGSIRYALFNLFVTLCSSEVRTSTMFADALYWVPDKGYLRGSHARRTGGKSTWGLLQ
jgi:hypothetical protein